MSGSSPLTLAQIDAMAPHFENPRDLAAFLLSCGCGLRSGTLCSLKVSHVLDSSHRLTGRVEIPRRAMKGKHAAHSVAIPKRALEAVGKWIAIHPCPHLHAPLFQSHRNRNRNISTRHWHRIFTAAAQAAGLEDHLSPHGARKFFAHAIYAHTDKDINLTTRALGNNSPAATTAYLDYGQRRISAATLAIFGENQLPLPAPENTEQKDSI